METGIPWFWQYTPVAGHPPVSHRIYRKSNSLSLSAGRQKKTRRGFFGTPWSAAGIPKSAGSITPDFIPNVEKNQAEVPETPKRS